MRGKLDIGFVASGDPNLDTFEDVSSGGTGPIRRLSERMAAKGHDISIYAGTHSGKSISGVGGATVHYLPTPDWGVPLDTMFDTIPGLDRIIRSERLSTAPGAAFERLFGRLVFSKRVSSVLAEADHDLVYYRDRFSAFVPVRNHCPSIFTVVAPDACSFFYDASVANHSMNALLFRYKRAVERSVVSRADETIVMNGRTRREYESLADSISVVTLGVESEHFVDRSIRRELPVVLYVGRFDRNKRPEHVLSAFAAADTGDHELHFVGSGPREEYVRALSEKSTVSDRVHFHGHLPREQVLERMREAAVFVLPSEFENCPNVIVEAMASGCPVIASNTMGARQLITDGQTGILFDKDDEGALRRALDELLHDEGRRKEIAKVAHEYARENHTMDVIADQYLDIGRRAIEQHE